MNIENTHPATHPDLAALFPGTRFYWVFTGNLRERIDSWALYSEKDSVRIPRATIAIDKGRSIDRFATYCWPDPCQYHGSLEKAMFGAEGQLCRAHQLHAAAND